MALGLRALRSARLPRSTPEDFLRWQSVFSFLFAPSKPSAREYPRCCGLLELRSRCARLIWFGNDLGCELLRSVDPLPNCLDLIGTSLLQLHFLQHLHGLGSNCCNFHLLPVTESTSRFMELENFTSNSVWKGSIACSLAYRKLLDGGLTQQLCYHPFEPAIRSLSFAKLHNQRSFTWRASFVHESRAVTVCCWSYSP